MTRTLHRVLVAASLLTLSCASPVEDVVEPTAPPPADDPPPETVQGPPGKWKARGCYDKWTNNTIRMRLMGGAKYHTVPPKHVIGGWFSHSAGEIEDCVENSGDALFGKGKRLCHKVSDSANHGAVWWIRWWDRCVTNPHWDADGDGWGPDNLNNPVPECLAEVAEVTPGNYMGWKKEQVAKFMDCDGDGRDDGYYCVWPYSSGGIAHYHRHSGHVANSYCFFSGNPDAPSVVPYKACDVHPSQKFKVVKMADDRKGDAFVFGLGYNSNHTDSTGGLTMNFAVGYKGAGAFWTEAPKADGGRWWHARNFSAQIRCGIGNTTVLEGIKRGEDPADGGDETLEFDGEWRF